MMYMHYCSCCSRIHMLNGHKLTCPKCDNTLTELRISYLDYVCMNTANRLEFITKCADPIKLSELCTKYRMFKYSKMYKKMQAKSIG